MKIIVKNNSGKLESEPRYSYPLTQTNIPDGEYQGYLVDQYCKENKLGGVYWLDGLSHEHNTREAIRITNYNKQEVVKQPFEEHTLLAKHIERMANTGYVGNTSEWSDFLRELNKSVK